MGDGNGYDDDDDDTQTPFDGVGGGLNQGIRSPRDEMDTPNNIHEEIPHKPAVVPLTKELVIQYNKHKYVDPERWI